MSTRYFRETGKHLPKHYAMQDVLEAMARWRSSPRWSAAFETTYMPIRRRAMKPVALPVYRKPVATVHPLFADMFRKMGIAA